MLKILNFINRIKEIFIKFFKNKNSLMLTDGIKNNEIEMIEDEYIDDDLILSFSSQQDKKDFFITYNNVKKGVIKLEDLLLTDMIKVELMMQEETELLNKKTSVIENQIKNLEYRKKCLKREENLLKEQSSK